MAYLAKAFSCFLLLVLFYSLQIQARESKFFSKFIHIGTNKKISESKVPHIKVPSGPLKPPKWPPALSTVLAAVPTPAPAPAPAFAPTLVESEKGYGLYGNVGPNQFTPTTVTDESELLNEELSAENYETENQNSKYNNNVYASNYYNNGYTNNKGYTTVYYNNNGYSNNFNNNGHETEKQGMSDTRFTENYETGNNNNNEYTNKYNNNDGFSSNYNNNGYETDQKQGMSDTRSYLNGRYFYNVENDRNPTGYKSKRQNEGYYGNTQTDNEFNTMEEYEKYQGNYMP